MVLYEIPEGEGRENYHSFYFTPWGEIKRKVHFSNSLFEAVFSAPEGMTLSYRAEGGKDKINLCSGDRQQGEPEPGTHQPVYLLAGRVSAGEKAIIAAGGQRVCGGTSITLYGKPDTV